MMADVKSIFPKSLNAFCPVALIIKSLELHYEGNHWKIMSNLNLLTSNICAAFGFPMKQKEELRTPLQLLLTYVVRRLEEIRNEIKIPKIYIFFIDFLYCCVFVLCLFNSDIRGSGLTVPQPIILSSCNTSAQDYV